MDQQFFGSSYVINLSKIEIFHISTKKIIYKCTVERKGERGYIYFIYNMETFENRASIFFCIKNTTLYLYNLHYIFVIHYIVLYFCKTGHNIQTCRFQLFRGNRNPVTSWTCVNKATVRTSLQSTSTAHDMKENLHLQSYKIRTSWQKKSSFTPN